MLRARDRGTDKPGLKKLRGLDLISPIPLPSLGSWVKISGGKLPEPLGAPCWPWLSTRLLNPSSPASDHLCSRNWETPSHLGLCLLSVKSILLPAPSRAWPSSSCRFQLIHHLHRVTFPDLPPSSSPPL